MEGKGAALWRFQHLRKNLRQRLSLQIDVGTRISHRRVEACVTDVTLPKTWRKVLVLTFDAIFYETNLNGESQDCRKVCEYPRAWEEVPASGQGQPTGCNASAPPELTAP